MVWLLKQLDSTGTQTAPIGNLIIMMLLLSSPNMPRNKTSQLLFHLVKNEMHRLFMQEVVAKLMYLYQMDIHMFFVKMLILNGNMVFHKRQKFLKKMEEEYQLLHGVGLTKLNNLICILVTNANFKKILTISIHNNKRKDKK